MHILSFLYIGKLQNVQRSLTRLDFSALGKTCKWPVLLHRLFKKFFINWVSLKFIRPLNGLTFHCNACTPDQYISIYLYMHTLNPRIFALGSPPYFMQFLLCSFAFLCKVTHRGSITIVNRLRKLSITSLVGHNESDTPLTLKLEMWTENCLFGEGRPHLWSNKCLAR